jgi:hypothetical protein
MSVIEVGKKEPAPKNNEQAVVDNGDCWCWAWFRAVTGVEGRFAYRTLAAWGESVAVRCVVGCHSIGTAISFRTTFCVGVTDKTVVGCAILLKAEAFGSVG